LTVAQGIAIAARGASFHVVVRGEAIETAGISLAGRASRDPDAGTSAPIADRLPNPAAFRRVSASVDVGGVPRLSAQ
jgi:hypothetical protein